MKIEHISGLDIIEMLNGRLLDENEDTDDVCIEGPLEFEHQQLNEGKYILKFSAKYNNWGTIQDIRSNRIHIDSNAQVQVFLEEPLDSDGSATFIQEKVQEFLLTYDPDPHHNGSRFSELLMDARARLSTIRMSTDQRHAENMDGVIELLKKARSMMFVIFIMFFLGCSPESRSGHIERTDTPNIDTLILVKIGITTGKRQYIVLHYENVRTGEKTTREVMEYESNIGDTVIFVKNKW